jgi:hypothetical protein
MTLVSRWAVAFASSPQSGLTWSCFLFPLIEPDRQISRIRLSEKTHTESLGRTAHPFSDSLQKFRAVVYIFCGHPPGSIGTMGLHGI